MPLLGNERNLITRGIAPRTSRRLPTPSLSEWREAVLSEPDAQVALRARGLRGEQALGGGGNARTVDTGADRRSSAGLFTTCGNPACSSGWLHLWRSRSAPVVEGEWSCSAECTSAMIESAIRRELEGRAAEQTTHRHRVPLGLVMLEQGWITAAQLRGALAAQKAAGHGKLGAWLVREVGVSEQMVTRALGLQWNCPVLPLEFQDSETMAAVLPRLFVEAFGVLPLRSAAGRLLYLGFEEKPDPVVALAVERMSAMRVEMGLVARSSFQEAHERMLAAEFPRTSLIEAVSESPLVRVLTKAIERNKPVQSRLVRMHDCLWLRMWTQPSTGSLPECTSVEDVICSLSPN